MIPQIDAHTLKFLHTYTAHICMKKEAELFMALTLLQVVNLINIHVSKFRFLELSLYQHG